MKYLIIGSGGQLGRAFIQKLGKNAVGMDLPGIDVTSVESVNTAVDIVQPEWIINCSAISDVDLCEREPDLAYEVHYRGIVNLAETGVKLLTFSTDHLFDGGRGRSTPFFEEDMPDPVNIYAESKLAGEREALSARKDNIVIRTSWLFSGSNGLIPFLWRSLKNKGKVRAVSDQISAISYTHDLVKQVLTVIDDGVSGILHVVGSDEFTPVKLAELISEYTGGIVESILWDSLGRDADRPKYSVLSSRRGYLLPDARNVIERWKAIND